MRPAIVPLLALALACGDAPRRPATKAAPPARPAIPGPAAESPRSPDRYRVVFTTSRGAFTVEVTRALAPRGADRFLELVQGGYYAGTRFYRVVPGFVAQWGIHGDPAVSARWREATIPDDPPRTGNVRGTIAFAASGPDTRATEVFVSTGDNRGALDRQRFAPFGTVVEGLDVVDRLNGEYGEEPNHAKIKRQGTAYLTRWFPALDSVVDARVVPPGGR
ncbi:MAG: peptidylprolyl isomerase [Gemmatimonadetes bacterium]|nr:peptidylprolyl isomerase [Gemmatimonadota bacterium]